MGAPKIPTGTSGLPFIPPPPDPLPEFGARIPTKKRIGVADLKIQGR